MVIWGPLAPSRLARRNLRPEMQTSPQSPSSLYLFIYIYLFIWGQTHWSACLFPLKISGNTCLVRTLYSAPSCVCCHTCGLGDLFALHECICADFIVLTGCIFFPCVLLQFYCVPVVGIHHPHCFLQKLHPASLCLDRTHYISS